MSKVTSKLQVTLPRAVARAHGIRPGSEIVFESAGEVIRVHPGAGCGSKPAVGAPREEALRWFDAATRRQAERDGEVLARLAGVAAGRGWSRVDLYLERGAG